METVFVSSFGEFHELIRRFLNNRQVLFRGHNRVDWNLVPRIGRKEYAKLNHDKFFASFRRRATEFLEVEPKNAWDWLAVAQHHGLPTPLLDWSYNPLVAAYFAVFPLEDEDCVVYAYYDSEPIETEHVMPEDYEGVGRLVPRGIAQRIVRQSGNFTFHSPYNLALEKAVGPNDFFVRIVIRKKYRREMIYELDKYGFNRMTLFPDLDGLCSYMAWSGGSAVRGFWTGAGKST
jgi:hypothetical protein